MSLWTLPSEAGCYLVVAIAGAAGLLRARVTFCGVILLIILLAYSLRLQPLTRSLFDIRWGGMFFFIHLYALFFSGACAYFWRHKIIYRNGYLLLAISAMLAGLQLGVFFGTLLFDLGYIYVIFCIGFTKNNWLSQWGRMGDFSYGMYLYGVPVQQLTIYYMRGEHFNMLTSMLITFLGALFCAIASWYIIEKPMLRYKKYE